MRIDIVSIFPQCIHAYLECGVVAQAIKKNLIQAQVHNLRDFSDPPHHHVDDRPYGGGDGMVFMPEPIGRALGQIKTDHRHHKLSNIKTIYLSPQGVPLNQGIIEQLATLDGMILLCGRYKGVDQRVLDAEVDAEYSLGDYVISGGELAALVLMDAVVRQCNGVLGNENSAKNDSFVHGMLDVPYYTRPQNYQGREVPEVLMSGHHAAIQRWHLCQMLGRTLHRRPDLFEKLDLSDAERELLKSYMHD